LEAVGAIAFTVLSVKIRISPFSGVMLIASRLFGNACRTLPAVSIRGRMYDAVPVTEMTEASAFARGKVIIERG